MIPEIKTDNGAATRLLDALKKEFVKVSVPVTGRVFVNGRDITGMFDRAQTEGWSDEDFIQTVMEFLGQHMRDGYTVARGDLPAGANNTDADLICAILEHRTGTRAYMDDATTVPPDILQDALARLPFMSDIANKSWRETCHNCPMGMVSNDEHYCIATKEERENPDICEECAATIERDGPPPTIFSDMQYIPPDMDDVITEYKQTTRGSIHIDYNGQNYTLDFLLHVTSRLDPDEVNPYVTEVIVGFDYVHCEGLSDENGNTPSEEVYWDIMNMLRKNETHFKDQVAKPMKVDVKTITIIYTEFGDAL